MRLQLQAGQQANSWHPPQPSRVKRCCQLTTNPNIDTASALCYLRCAGMCCTAPWCDAQQSTALHTSCVCSSKLLNGLAAGGAAKSHTWRHDRSRSGGRGSMSDGRAACRAWCRKVLVQVQKQALRCRSTEADRQPRRRRRHLDAAVPAGRHQNVFVFLTPGAVVEPILCVEHALLNNTPRAHLQAGGSGGRHEAGAAGKSRWRLLSNTHWPCMEALLALPVLPQPTCSTCCLPLPPKLTAQSRDALRTIPPPAGPTHYPPAAHTACHCR